MGRSGHASVEDPRYFAARDVGPAPPVRRWECVIEPDRCARCTADVDEAGFCSTCGAVTIAGELHVAEE
jgi:hypothetical protein